jgi:hypothetical protein
MATLPSADILSLEDRLSFFPPTHMPKHPKHHEPKLWNLLVLDPACTLANKLRAAPVTPGDDKKETPMVFEIRRWRMGALNKLNKRCIALAAVCFLFGCAARLQETTQIECTGSDGQLLYAGPYNEENLSEYIVQVDPWTLAVYRKGACRKVQA